MGRCGWSLDGYGLIGMAPVAEVAAPTAVHDPFIRDGHPSRAGTSIGELPLSGGFAGPGGSTAVHLTGPYAVEAFAGVQDRPTFPGLLLSKALARSADRQGGSPPPVQPSAWPGRTLVTQWC